MEILKARAHHAENLRKMVAGEIDLWWVRNNYPKMGYPDELIEIMINSVTKLKNGSAELEIAESGPDYICNACIAHSNGNTPCSTQGKQAGRDENVLIKRNMKIGQRIKFV